MPSHAIRGSQRQIAHSPVKSTDGSPLGDLASTDCSTTTVTELDPELEGVVGRLIDACT